MAYKISNTNHTMPSKSNIVVDSDSKIYTHKIIADQLIFDSMNTIATDKLITWGTVGDQGYFTNTHHIQSIPVASGAPFVASIGQIDGSTMPAWSPEPATVQEDYATKFAAGTLSGDTAGYSVGGSVAWYNPGSHSIKTSTMVKIPYADMTDATEVSGLTNNTFLMHCHSTVDRAYVSGGADVGASVPFSGGTDNLRQYQLDPSVPGFIASYDEIDSFPFAIETASLSQVGTLRANGTFGGATTESHTSGYIFGEFDIVPGDFPIPPAAIPTTANFDSISKFPFAAGGSGTSQLVGDLTTSYTGWLGREATTSETAAHVVRRGEWSDHEHNRIPYATETSAVVPIPRVGVFSGNPEPTAYSNIQYTAMGSSESYGFIIGGHVNTGPQPNYYMLTEVEKFTFTASITYSSVGDLTNGTAQYDRAIHD